MKFSGSFAFTLYYFTNIICPSDAHKFPLSFLHEVGIDL